MITRSLPSFFLTAICILLLGGKPADLFEANRIITVRDGLPQSYVSGIYQDTRGFLWLATLNGLGRYDGRGFKTYLHQSSDPEGLSDNIILYLFDAGNNNVWLCYMDGRVDQFNVLTEKVTHLWKNHNFEMLCTNTPHLRTLVRDGKGFAWMLANDGTVYRIGMNTYAVKHYTSADIGSTQPALGIVVKNEQVLVCTQTGLVKLDEPKHAAIKEQPYPFGKIDRYSPIENNVYSPALRSNGDLLFADKKGIKIWNPDNGGWKFLPLACKLPPGKLVASFDHDGNYYFERDSIIYELRPDNTLVKWSATNKFAKGLSLCMFTDRSGVLWAGTNGFGLRQYNLFKTGLPGFENGASFITDALIKAGAAPEQIRKTFLERHVPFGYRVTAGNDSVWITDIYYARPGKAIRLALVAKNQVREIAFRHFEAGAAKEISPISFLTVGGTGTLWGINQRHQLVKFDKEKLITQTAGNLTINRSEEINGLATVDDHIFYVSTNKNLYRYDKLTHETKRLTESLPSKDLLYITNDPDQREILWIGTLSDGLIRFNTNTSASQVFTIQSGLPSNTIYSILIGNDGLLWCSSNKGIFAFNKRNETIRSFTTRDGLIDDEFNRYYSMQLPGGDLAFGGPAGFTVFNPAKLGTDVFDPPITITDISINNQPHPPAPSDNGKEMRLRHDQNFVSVTYTAMQFDQPEKIQYRHKLQGLDADWVMTGNDNKAVYTSLPPATYTLLLSATNTAGKWSSHITKLSIRIEPPFWRTWWFYALMIALLGAVIYAFLWSRIRSIKKAQAQKLLFEREALELHAMALRAQMNPHFIFNCLNSIKALIQEKHTKEAVAYLTTFSILIRRQLSNKSNEITLKEELETCRLYLELEAMRFDERIQYVFDITEDEELLHTKIPPLILQPLVENAIIHGLLPSEHGGRVTIKVYREEDYCVCEIRDNGIGIAASQRNKQMRSSLHRSEGLHLLEERIAMNNQVNGLVNSLQTVSLVDETGNPAGTLVIIKFYIAI